MIPALAAVIGFVAGLAAHDLGVQGLRDDPLRPLAGTCPRCRNRRGWLTVRCPSCGRRPSMEFVVAAGTAVFAWFLVSGTGVSWFLVAYLGFALLTAALVVTDLAELRIVDRLNLPGTAVLAVLLAALALANGQGADLLRGLGGAGAYFTGTLLMWVIAGGRGFGAGDVKLSPLLGLYTTFLSWGTLGWAVFITAMVGGVAGAAVLVFGRGGAKTELPYGPPMVMGAWVAIVLAVTGTIPT